MTRPHHEPSELLQNWRIVIGCFLGLASGVSSLYFYSAGLFLKPVAAEFGWSRGTASLGPLVSILLLGCAAPFIGQVIDRYGARRAALCSLIGLSFSFFLLGYLTQGLASFLTLVTVLTIVGGATSPVSFTRILVAKFSRQRGLALGIAITGTGAGAILTPLMVTPAIASFGWRATYFALAAAALAFVPVIAFFLRGADSAVGEERKASGSKGNLRALADPNFLRIATIFLLCSIGIFGTIVHVVPMLTDIGIAPVRAARLASVLGVAVIVGRIVTGLLLDLFEAALLSATLFLFSAAGMLVLAVGGADLVLVGLLLTGFSVGAEFDLAAYLVGRRFPLKLYSTTFGGVYAAVAIGGGVGPFLAGQLFDHSGSYVYWLYLAAGVLLVAALISFTERSGARLATRAVVPAGGLRDDN
ncbi:MFS transporter [Cupriavidus basilensis]|uniref:MFS transporter n=1 Tax=Cupriavidus basilensis TaxID=68895 RepID=UPI0039F6AC4D